jgi:yecA family protein
MSDSIDPFELDAALRRCGSGWGASQAHGLLCSRLALLGPDALADWLRQVLVDSDETHGSRKQCEDQLRDLHGFTYRQLAERGSEFELLLPGDTESTAVRTAAMAQWCDGFLHGLVLRAEGDRLKKRLASAPLDDIIRDLLEISRAAVDDSADDESNETAFAELTEYLRVVAQLVYEELAEFRRPASHSLVGSGPSQHVH